LLDSLLQEIQNGGWLAFSSELWYRDAAAESRNVEP